MSREEHMETMRENGLSEHAIAYVEELDAMDVSRLLEAAEGEATDLLTVAELSGVFRSNVQRAAVLIICLRQRIKQMDEALNGRSP